MAGASPKYNKLISYENGVISTDWDCMEDFITNGPDLIEEPFDYFNLFTGCDTYDDVEERLMNLFNQCGLKNLEMKVEKNDDPNVVREKQTFKSYVLVLNTIIFVGALSKLDFTVIENNMLDQELVEMIKPKDMKITSGARSSNDSTSILRIEKNNDYHQSSFWTGFFNTNTISQDDKTTEDLTKYVLEPGYNMFQFYQLLCQIPEGLSRGDISTMKIVWAPELNTRLQLHGQYSVLVNYRQPDPETFLHISYTNISEMWNSYYHYYQLRVLKKPFGCNGKSSLKYTNNDVFKTLQYLRKGDSVAGIGNDTRSYKKKYTKNYSNNGKFNNNSNNRFSKFKKYK